MYDSYIYAIVLRYRRFRQMGNFLKKKICVENFRLTSQKLIDLFAYLHADERTDRRTTFWVLQTLWQFVPKLLMSIMQSLLFGEKAKSMTTLI